MTSWFTSARLRKCLIAASAKVVFIHSIPEFYPSYFSPLSLLLCHHSQIKVLDGEDEYYKLLSTVESIPEEECVTTPPPTLSSGPFVSQSWASHPCQPVRQTHQTCRQTLQRASSVLDVLRHMDRPLLLIHRVHTKDAQFSVIFALFSAL